jgi:hypothetical protein
MAHAISGSGSNDLGLGAVVTAVKREYDDMPGLTLTLEQARRLWALEPRICSVVLARLVESGYLCRTDAGQYARPTAA